MSLNFQTNMTSKDSTTFKFGSIIKTFSALAIILSTSAYADQAAPKEPMPPHLAPHISKKAKKEPVKDNLETPTHTYHAISEVELQGIIDKLSNKDKKVMHNIQKQIANWPEEIFQEIRAYNQFMALVNKEAKEKYHKLSAAAKQAIKMEENLKKDLSKQAIETLASLHIEESY